VTAPVEHANGTALPVLVPFAVAGPVSRWPREGTPQAEAVVQEAALAGSKVSRLWSWLRAIDGDTVITWSMAATVALVAVDAAIVSYSHIYGLATGQWGTGAETGIQARLLPLSIDGVILEASLVKLHAARHKIVRASRRKIRMPTLATCMLWLGIVATVAANVTHGLPSSLLSPVAHLVIMALLSAWPAGALIGSVEMAMGLVRDKHAVASARGSDVRDDSVAVPDVAVPDVAAPSASRQPRRRTTKPGKRTTTRASSRTATPPAATGTADPVVAAIKDHDAWKAGRKLTRADKDAIATTARVSRRSVERCLSDARRMSTAKP